MSAVRWRIEPGEGPVVAVAQHAGHDVSPDVLSYMAVDEATRLREEDPFTDGWLFLGDHRAQALQSRFEVDFNRPRELAIYAGPAQAWGIDVWREPLPDPLRQRTLQRFDAWHAEVDRLLDAVVTRHDRVLLLDLHSYCHRRGGPDAPHDDPALNPEINLCTATLDGGRWGSLLDRFEAELQRFDLDGWRLDVRRDVKFTGGTFVQRVNRERGDRVCALQVEVRKSYMDEWTGVLEPERHAAYGRALAAALAAVRPLLGTEQPDREARFGS